VSALDEAGPLARLCRLYGIAFRYTDIWGSEHRLGTEAARALLGAMGVDAADDAAVNDALAERERRQRLVPPAVVVRATNGAATAVPLAATDPNAALDWTLEQENGARSEGSAEGEQLRGEDGTCRLLLPGPLAPGYHHLHLRHAGAELHARLIVTPQRCYLPPALSGEGRVWGPAAQLYALHSRRSWGIGDFTDLRTLVEACAGAGADVVGVNPLHALFPAHPERASPYGPSSRLFLNVLYIDVEAVADFQHSDAARALLRTPAFQHRLGVLRGAREIDYAEVAALKLAILDALYADFRHRELEAGGARGRAFERYRAERGAALERHALYEALHEHLQGRDARIWGWPVWPQELRDPQGPAVAAFAAAEHVRVGFYAWLQWLAEEQLAAVGRASFAAGLGVGLYQDLAVSVDRAGAEAWGWQHLYARGASIGAPPDDFNLAGQDWGLPPLVPDALVQAGYAPFIDTLRANMRHAGALRIDHVMGLMRLFWIPQGMPATEGAYVHYPFEALLGIVALESQRNRCMVVGEDLGTVPDAVRAALGPAGVLSYRLLYFEKDAGGAFRAPAAYPEQALVAVSTHDLATLAGFWAGHDLQERAALGLFPDEQVHERQVLDRGEDRARVLFALEREQLLPAPASVDPVSVPAMTAALARAVHRYLARTPARLLLVQLEDVLGQLEQTNLPGTTGERANWRHRLGADLETLLGDDRWRLLAAALSAERRPTRRADALPPASAVIPRATYRLQLHAGFTFADAAAILPYLAQLGISHVYCSPYLTARAGSHHGYDIVDHGAINPELGSAGDYDRFVDTLHAHGMGQILDIVPNHMGVGGQDNAWWLDVLEHGQASRHAPYFDIDWSAARGEHAGKVLLPVLGAHYGEVLERGELQLVFDPAAGTLAVWYHEHCFPLDPCTYPQVLGRDAERLARYVEPGDPLPDEYLSLLTAFRNLPPREEADPDRVAERRRDCAIHKNHLAHLYARSQGVRNVIDENVAFFNGAPGDAASFDDLHALLDAQAYRPAHWRVAGDEINYRRFFDINDLAGLRTENPEVFARTHRLVMDLVGSGRVNGLRIDHPDGLYAPAQYYRRLQTAAAAALRGEPDPVHALEEKPVPDAGQLPLYVVAEKILAAHETLPEDWLVHGTTGYDFLNLVSGLFVDGASERAFERIYQRFTGRRERFEDLLYERKKLIMRVSLASELNVLANQLSRIAEMDRYTRDFTWTALRDALAEVVACFPVYRTYVTPDGAGDIDRRYVDWAVAVARRRSLAGDTSIFGFVRNLLLLQDMNARTAAYRAAAVELALRFQQYTAPVTAKGLEDTSFYIYNRLTSLNEVGGDPQRFGVSVSAFHHANQARRRRWPHAMLCTATHDSKRGADLRVRIDALSHRADAWRRHLARWSRLNRIRKRRVGDEPAPDRNDEYLIYQTLLGAWPAQADDAHALAGLGARLEGYLVKAVREAKRRTSWLNPDAEYEDAVVHFVRELLAQPQRNAFLAEFMPFQREIARAGVLAGLVQAALQLTVPGVPDLYQGTELWDLSLVDPDNRRPIDYQLRGALLGEMAALAEAPAGQRAARLRGLCDAPGDGRLKLYLIHRLLALRASHEALLRDGDYAALEVDGPLAGDVVAFARTRGEQALLVMAAIAPRATPVFCDRGCTAGRDRTRVLLPDAFAGVHRQELLGGVPLAGAGNEPTLNELFATLPVAVLASARD